MKKLAVFLSLFIIIITAQAANSMDNNKGKSTPEIEKKIDALLTQLTLEEKLELIGGTGFASKPIERLGIPAINMTDGPVGVRWNDNTAFPVSAAMAATWNTGLVNKIGIALGEETKAQGRNMLLGPCVNIVRVPMAGRNFETFGEDPYLTSRLAVAYINGVQSENVMASVKHFAVNNQEDGRMFIDTKVGERTLNEIYFPAFKAAVQEAGAWTVMSAYNKINGPYCSESDYLLNKTLKQDWGFEGFVVSDWGAVHSVEGTANYGADIEMPTGEFMNPKNLTELVKSGKVKESTIDDKVRRLLRTMFLSGMMDGKLDKGATDTKEHRALALEAARESIVLLKNENGILPLDENKIKSIAIIGPNAAVARTGGGGSSMVSPVYSVSPLEGLKNLLGSKAKLNYAQGASVKGDIKSIDPSNLKTEFSGKTENGLKAEYFNNKILSGEPAVTRIEKDLTFHWVSGSPAKEIGNDNFSLRLTGKLVPSETGTYELGALSDDGARVYLDGKEIMNGWGDHAIEYYSAKVSLEKGKEYDLKIEYYENGGEAYLKFGWGVSGEKLLAEAVEVAKNSDMALLFLGNTFQIESEGFDRKDILLSPEQVTLVKEIARVNKNIVVVLNNGAAIDMRGWIGDAKAIVEAWFPGQEGGSAIAEVLFGKINPSGKLPVTFPMKWEDCSAYGSYKPGDSSTTYTDGIFVGYRHFDKKNIEPLFPFGYGLSYSKFEYGGLKVTAADEGGVKKYKVQFSVKNVSDRKGTEIAQLYVAPLSAKVERPVKELKKFARVELNPGETKNVEFILDEKDFSYYSVEKHGWTADSGEYEAQVGASSRDIKLKEKIKL